MFFLGPSLNVNFLLSARATEIWSGSATCSSISGMLWVGDLNRLRGLDAPEQGLRAGVQALSKSRCWIL